MAGHITRLKQARLDAGWSQTQLIAAMMRHAGKLRITLPGPESMKTNIRRWENDHVVPGTDYRQVLRAVFSMSDAELGFPPADQDEHCAVNEPFMLSSDGLAYFDALLAAHVDADNRLGPRHVLAVLENEVQQLSRVARAARGPLRHDVLVTTVRFHELLGWVQQDSGLTTRAMASTNRAFDLALEVADPVWNAYLLMRKSNIATDAGDPSTAIALADAALRATRKPPPRLHAVILRQKANAHAAIREIAPFEAAIDQSRTQLLRPNPDDGAPMAAYCTDRYLAMEAANCWTRLRRPGQAVELLVPVGASRDSEARRAQRREPGRSRRSIPARQGPVSGPFGDGARQVGRSREGMRDRLRRCRRRAGDPVRANHQRTQATRARTRCTSRRGPRHGRGATHAAARQSLASWGQPHKEATPHRASGSAEHHLAR